MIRWSFLLLVGCGTSEEAVSPEATDLGYAIGYQVGTDFQNGEPAIDADAVVAGIRDALAEREPALPVEAQERELQVLNRKRGFR